jgi:hypothetical protein
MERWRPQTHFDTCHVDFMYYSMVLVGNAWRPEQVYGPSATHGTSPLASPPGVLCL